jgi:hypothetical protein
LWVDSQTLFLNRLPTKTGWEIHPASNADPNDVDWKFVSYEITRSSGDAGWRCYKKGEVCGTLSTQPPTVTAAPIIPVGPTTTAAPTNCAAQPLSQQHTCLLNRIIELENDIKTLTNTQGTQSTRLQDYLQKFNQLKARWTSIG